jgi:hypothetical protein
VNLRFQIARGAIAAWRPTPAALAILAFALFWISPARTYAQDAPPGAVGRVEGRDITIESGTAAGGGTATSAPGIYVVNGSVVTVHSAKAKMTLFAGGKVAICGPAKFTVLLSGDAITLALNFGRVRVDLPAKTALRVFTPTIIGTPLDISGGSRDVTIGLNLDDSLCVLATSGAIRLENQFSDEKLVVPQAGEFFLNAGKLLPVAGTPGSCQCLADEPAAPPAPARIPAFADAPPPSLPPSAVVAAAKPPVEPPQPAVERNVEYSILANANEEHPIVQPVKNEAPVAPPASAPLYTVVLPPLVFLANSPPPPDPGPDMVVLIREARVSPEWEFSGHVAAPEFAQAVQHALGQDTATNVQSALTDQSADKPKKKKSGFWAALRKVFG